MMDKVKLRSPHWGPLVCQGLYELYKEKIGVNVAIYGSDGGIMDAHACVLMAVSPTLKTWLAGDPIQGCHSVEMESIRCETWGALLDFIYSGTVSVESDQVQSVLEAAEKLQMQSLVRVCADAMNTSSSQTGSDLPPLISSADAKPTNTTATIAATKSIVPNIIKQSIRSTITPIQPHQDNARVAKQPEQVSPPSDLPPLISQQPAKGFDAELGFDRRVERENETGSQREHEEETSTKGQTEQPLDLTKDIDNPSVPNTASPTKSQQQMPPSPLSSSGAGPQNGGQNGGIPDPQMQAVMAVYYNQMLQYSMLAQKMGGGAAGQFGAPNMPNMPNMANMPKLPNGMPMMPPPPHMMGGPPPHGSPFMAAPHLQQQQDDTSVDGRQRKFPCSICGMLFFTRHVKEQHELTHTNLKPYGCNICGFRARQKAVIWRHKKNRHPEADSSVSMDSLTMLPPTGSDTAGDMNVDEAEEDDMGDGVANEDEQQEDDEEDDASLSMAMKDDSDQPTKPNGMTEANQLALQSQSDGPLSLESKMSDYTMMNEEQDMIRAKPMSALDNRMKHLHAKPGVPFDGQNMPSTPDTPRIKPKAMSTPGRDGEGSMTDIEEEVRNAVRTEDGGYLCRICGRSLKSKIILQEHIMTHYNVRRYPCCYCNYRAKQRAGLYNHMKVKHKGLKPVWPSKTKRPPFTFPGSPSVKERLNRSFQERQKTNVFHVGLVRKHSCKTCGKSFRMKNTLEKHELIHMNIKRYSCRYCGFKAKRKSTIEKHIAERHPGMKVQILDLYSNRSMSPIDEIEGAKGNDESSESTEPELVEDLSAQRPPMPAIDTSIPSKPIMLNGLPPSSAEHPEMIPTDLRVPMIPRPQMLNATMTPPPQIRREPGERAPRTPMIPGQQSGQQMREHQPHPMPEQMMGMPNMQNGGGGGVTMLNGSVGILQLELPKSQRDALESPNTNFSSYGTPDKPHRCKTCGRCFRLRHVMEQHELTHFNFRKYMCDICGFRAKQKAVIYRHKKVKHPNHPGAGRVTLVPEYALPYGRTMPMPTSAMQPSANLGLPMAAQAMMTPIAQPTSMTPSPIVVAPTPQHKLSPSNNPELSHNNNKGAALSPPSPDADEAQDLSIGSRSATKRERDEEPIDMKLSPSEPPKFNPMDMKMNMDPMKMNAMNLSVLNAAMERKMAGNMMGHNNMNGVNPLEQAMNKMNHPIDLKISPNNSAFMRSPMAKHPWYSAPPQLPPPGAKNGATEADSGDNEDDSDSLKSSENITSNLAMGLPSMVPTSRGGFMGGGLPMIAPLSPPESISNSTSGNHSNSASPTTMTTQSAVNGGGAKKYSCQVCGRSFKHRHVLEQHYITHTGLRPYKCEFCDFCARQKASLWRHKQKHLHQQI